MRTVILPLLSVLAHFNLGAFSLKLSPIAEFGGFKESGFGRESGMQAIYDYTRPKTVWINTSAEPMANPFVMR